MSDTRKTYELTFLDGEKRTVRETTYSRAVARATWERVEQGADTHKELHVASGDMPCRRGECGCDIRIKG